MRVANGWMIHLTSIHNGDMNMTTKYAADFGILWETEAVARQRGEHRTDRVALRFAAEIPIPMDLDKIRAAIGDERVRGFLNGSSMRVVAQDVNRRYIEACVEGTRTYDQEELRGLVWARISGRTVRLSSGKTVTVTVKGNYNKKGLSIRSGDGLITALRNAGFSTPTTQFVCWYMGFPSDWLSSGSSATPVCRRKRAELSKSSRAARKKAKAQHE